MTTIASLTRADALALERRAQRSLRGAPSLEAAAQRHVETIYETLADSLVLLRLFATVPYAELPAANREFVDEIAAAAGARAALTAKTLVLSLLGTMGVEANWCDRRRSLSHVGIPLISPEFVAAIPMIARLLKQFGVRLDWITREDTAIVGKTFGLQSGFFHVLEAATAVDGEGRKIIAAQDFVARYGIETVFGVGGGYVGTPVYATIIGFCRERVDAATAERFLTHIDRFKAETEALVRAGRLFTDR